METAPRMLSGRGLDSPRYLVTMLAPMLNPTSSSFELGWLSRYRDNIRRNSPVSPTQNAAEVRMRTQKQYLLRLVIRVSHLQLLRAGVRSITCTFSVINMLFPSIMQKQSHEIMSQRNKKDMRNASFNICCNSTAASAWYDHPH